MKQNWAERLRASMHHQAESLGNLLVEAFHYLALFAIGATVFWAAGAAFLGMVNKGHASIDDILLLFIYLELGAMVGIYFKTNHMPVRFLIYVAMTALTRLMIADIQHNHTPDDGIILVSVALLLLALAIRGVRFASARFPSAKSAAGAGGGGGGAAAGGGVRLGAAGAAAGPRPASGQRNGLAMYYHRPVVFRKPAP